MNKRHRRRSRAARATPLSLGIVILALLVAASGKTGPAVLIVGVLLLLGGEVIYIRWRNKVEYQQTMTHLRYRQFVDVSPTEFEGAVGQLFREHGFAVIRSGKMGDGGVDLEMTKDGFSFLAQCKRYTTEPIGEPLIRDFYGTLAHRRAHHGYFITTSYYTGPAKAFARNKPITLIDERGLQEWLNESVLPESSHMEQPPSPISLFPPTSSEPTRLAAPNYPTRRYATVFPTPGRLAPARNKWRTVAIVLWSMIIGACLLLAVLIIVANWHNPALGF